MKFYFYLTIIILSSVNIILVNYEAGILMVLFGIFTKMMIEE